MTTLRLEALKDDAVHTGSPSGARSEPRRFLKWKLAPESDPQERCIITTEDGEEEICGIVYREDDADLIVTAVNRYLEQGGSAAAAGKQDRQTPVKVHVGNCTLSRDLVWCECGRGLSVTGKWAFCPRCGHPIDQESYAAASEAAQKHAAWPGQYATPAEEIEALRAQLAAVGKSEGAAPKAKFTVPFDYVSSPAPEPGELVRLIEGARHAEDCESVICECWRSRALDLARAQERRIVKLTESAKLADEYGTDAPEP